jgi:DNA-binding response OmpR family regulator
MNHAKILIIDDDPTVLALTKDLLLKEGYAVLAVSTGGEGWERLQKEDFDLLVLDLGLPDMDGLELCGKVKRDPRVRGLPVLILTARSSSDDVVKGLEEGAEDYLPKPFNEREFIARTRAILRRFSPSGPRTETLSSGKINMSLASHETWCSEKPVSLTLREFDILRVFLSHPGKALSREEIVAKAWGPTTATVPKVVDVHVGHLRVKLGGEGKRIETVPQVGYKLALPKK